MESSQSSIYYICRGCGETLPSDDFSDASRVCDACHAADDSGGSLAGNHVTVVQPRRTSAKSLPITVATAATSLAKRVPAMVETAPAPAPSSPAQNGSSAHTEAVHLRRELTRRGWEEDTGGWYHPKLTRTLGLVTFDAALMIQIRGGADLKSRSPRTCSELFGA